MVSAEARFLFPRLCTIAHINTILPNNANKILQGARISAHTAQSCSGLLALASRTKFPMSVTSLLVMPMALSLPAALH